MLQIHALLQYCTRKCFRPGDGIKCCLLAPRNRNSTRTVLISAPLAAAALHTCPGSQLIAVLALSWGWSGRTAAASGTAGSGRAIVPFSRIIPNDPQTRMCPKLTSPSRPSRESAWVAGVVHLPCMFVTMTHSCPQLHLNRRSMRTLSRSFLCMCCVLCCVLDIGHAVDVSLHAQVHYVKQVDLATRLGIKA